MQVDPDITTVVPPPEGTTELVVDWQRQAPAIAPHAACHILDRWEHYLAEAKAQGRTLFDGAITQLLGAESQTSSGTTRMTLHLAPGCYKEFLVTRLRDRPWFAAHAPDCGVLALGNSALITHGAQVLLGRRSPKVSCYAGRLHLIGGVLEALGTTRFPAAPEGILAHLEMELHEEVGLRDGEARHDGWPRVLGLAQDNVLGQPELFWQWEMAVDLAELCRRVDLAEHSAALVLRQDQMSDDLWEQLTPVARLAWRLWMRANPQGRSAASRK